MRWNLKIDLIHLFLMAIPMFLGCQQEPPMHEFLVKHCYLKDSLEKYADSEIGTRDTTAFTYGFLMDTSSLYIRKVFPKQSEAHNQLNSCDQIVELNDSPIESYTDFRYAFPDISLGDTAQFKVKRGDSMISVGIPIQHHYEKFNYTSMFAGMKARPFHGKINNLEEDFTGVVPGKVNVILSFFSWCPQGLGALDELESLSADNDFNEMNVVAVVSDAGLNHEVPISPREHVDLFYPAMESCHLENSFSSQYYPGVSPIIYVIDEYGIVNYAIAGYSNNRMLKIFKLARDLIGCHQK